MFLMSQSDTPKNDELREFTLLYYNGLFFSHLPLNVLGVRFCDKCKAIKPDRAHHCSVCGRCVLKMDHHCPW